MSKQSKLPKNPVLDLNHPFVRKAAMIAVPKDGWFIELFSNELININSVENEVSINHEGVFTDGYGHITELAYFSSTPRAYVHDAVRSHFTHICVFRAGEIPIGADGSAQVLWSDSNIPGASFCQINFSSDLSYQPPLDVTPANVTFSVDMSEYFDRQPHVLVITGSSERNISLPYNLYIDGKYIDSQSLAPWGNATRSGLRTGLNISSSSGSWTRGGPRIELYAQLGIELSSAEVASISANPYQLFKQKNIVGVHELPPARTVTFEKPWTRQPPAGTPIDWSSPLTRGLLHFFPEYRDSQWRCLVTGDAATLSSGTPATAISPDGIFSHDFENDTDAEFTLTSPTLDAHSDSSNAITIGFWQRHGATDVSGTVGVSLYDSTDPADQITSLFCHTTNDSNQGVGPRVVYQGGTVINDNSDSYATGEWVHYVFTSRHGEDHELYINGISVASDTLLRALRSEIDEIGIGHFNSGNNCRSALAGITIHSRGMNAVEIRDWYQNYFAIFKPQRIEMPYNEALPELAKFEVDH